MHRSTHMIGVVSILATVSIAAVGVLAVVSPGTARDLVGVSKCIARDGGALPDPSCTPGAINHAVTQATISKTICKPGWATSVRPPLGVTEPQKFASMRAYGDSTATGQAAKYEYDHLIPIEIGGAVDDARNLWPESHALSVGGGPDVGSRAKDRIENKLHGLVCAGKMKLARARRIMRTDWRAGVSA